MRWIRKGTPPRLPLVFGKDTPPLYLITFNTHRRKPLLACAEVHNSFRTFAGRAEELRIGVGRYVLMPDHVHLFVRFAGPLSLGVRVKSLKQTLGKTLSLSGCAPPQCPGQQMRSFWQPGFFDHLLRRDESYAEKWRYVWMNPVRAGLVADPDDWPYQGEIVRIDRA